MDVSVVLFPRMVVKCKDYFAGVCSSPGSLAAYLRKVARLPPGPADENGKPTKVGLDDFLLAHGPLELQKILDAAEDPEPADTGIKFLESAWKDDQPSIDTMAEIIGICTLHRRFIVAVQAV